MAFKKLGALFLQPRSQGRYSAADFRGISTEHMMRSLGKKLVDCATDPEHVFCLCKGCGGSRNLKDHPDWA